MKHLSTFLRGVKMYKINVSHFMNSPGSVLWKWRKTNGVQFRSVFEMMAYFKGCHNFLFQFEKKNWPTFSSDHWNQQQHSPSTFFLTTPVTWSCSEKKKKKKTTLQRRHSYFTSRHWSCVHNHWRKLKQCQRCSVYSILQTSVIDFVCIYIYIYTHIYTHTYIYMCEFGEFGRRVN